jgi:predicted Fe-Mo cluster-binding NifX family protein
MTSTRRIAIAAEGDRGLESDVSAHFGRCPFYVMVELCDGQRGAVEVLANPFFGQHQPGVVPQFLHEHRADVVLAGGMGPRAIAMFRRFGIDVVTGALGNAGKVLDAYLQGELRGIVPCEHDHPDSCGEHGRGRGQGQCHE